MPEFDPHRVKRSDYLAPLLIIALLAAVPPIAQLAGDPFMIKVATRIVIFSIVAVMLNFIIGFAGLVSLVQAGFFGLGGYVVAIAAHHSMTKEPISLGPLSWTGTTDLLLTLPLSGLIAALVAFITGLVSLRTSGPYFLMITLAFNQMLYYGAIALQKYGGEDGLQILQPITFAGFDMSSRWKFFYLSLALLGIILALFSRVIASRFGIVLRASAENERRVTVSGIPPYPYRLAAFVICGAIAGLGGALLAASQQFVSPVEMNWVQSGDFVVMAVIGGLSTIWGPVIGATAFVILELVLSTWTQHWHLAFGIIIVALSFILRGKLSDLLRLIPASGGRPQ